MVLIDKNKKASFQIRKEAKKINTRFRFLYIFRCISKKWYFEVFEIWEGKIILHLLAPIQVIQRLAFVVNPVQPTVTTSA